MPPLFLKRQTADFAGAGPVTLGLEEVWRHGGTGCTLANTALPETLLLAPGCAHADGGTAGSRTVFHPFLIMSRGEYVAANLVKSPPSRFVLYSRTLRYVCSAPPV